ncbi:hypothetical protein K2X33_12835 [bacterium]|nr:hypothetical protein [bacterium]
MKQTFFLISVICLASACDFKARERAHNEYHRWVARFETTNSVDTDKLQGAWMRTNTIKLAHDPVKSEFDEAFEVPEPKSGVLLLFSGDKMAQEYIHFGCPSIFPHAKWLVEQGSKPEDDTRSPGKNVRGFLAGLRSTHADNWFDYQLDGETLVTPKWLSNYSGKVYEKRIVSLDDKKLQLAFTKGEISHGVHGLIEEYERLDEKKLAEYIKESNDVKPCPEGPLEPMRKWVREEPKKEDKKK